jgi:hypothetical protein
MAPQALQSFQGERMLGHLHDPSHPPDEFGLKIVGGHSSHVGGEIIVLAETPGHQDLDLQDDLEVHADNVDITAQIVDSRNPFGGSTHIHLEVPHTPPPKAAKVFVARLFEIVADRGDKRAVLDAPYSAETASLLQPLGFVATKGRFRKPKLVRPVVLN